MADAGPPERRGVPQWLKTTLTVVAWVVVGVVTLVVLVGGACLILFRVGGI